MRTLRNTRSILSRRKSVSRLAIISYVRPILHGEVILAREIIIHHRISGLIGRRLFLFFSFFFPGRTESDCVMKRRKEKVHSWLKCFRCFSRVHSATLDKSNARRRMHSCTYRLRKIPAAGNVDIDLISAFVGSEKWQSDWKGENHYS